MLIRTLQGGGGSVPRLGSHAVISSSPSGYFVREFLNVHNNNRKDHFCQIPTSRILFHRICTYSYMNMYSKANMELNYTEHQFML